MSWMNTAVLERRKLSALLVLLLAVAMSTVLVGSAEAAALDVKKAAPRSGPVGTVVTISGTGFTGLDSITVDGQNVTDYLIVSDSQVVLKAPAGGSGAGDIVVNDAAGTPTTDTLASGFTYVEAPTVTAISPATGSATGGTTLTITGTNLSRATVTFDGKRGGRATVNAAGTSLTVKTPKGEAGDVDVVVTTPGGSVTDSTGFDYVPGVSKLSPNKGSVDGGTVVTVTGAGFTGASAVTVGGVAASDYFVVSDAKLLVTVPASTTDPTAGAASVSVTTASGTSADVSGDDFTYEGPYIASMTPTSGASGTLVTLSGSGFTDATSVTVGGVQVVMSTVGINSDGTTLRFLVPAGAVDGHVRVRTAKGTSAERGATTTYDVP